MHVWVMVKLWFQGTFAEGWLQELWAIPVQFSKNRLFTFSSLSLPGNERLSSNFAVVHD
jgi:hypothetical protein